MFTIVKSGMIIGFLCLLRSGYGQDTISTVKNKEIVFTSRLHSTGHFPYSGSLLNHHLNADFNLYYTNNQNGFFIFKAIDMEDIKSDINYLQIGVFRKIFIAKKMTITPYAGYLFLQNNKFLDKGSDLFLALAPAFESYRLKIENTTLITNILEKDYPMAMANRLEIKYTFKPFAISWFTWHNMILSETKNQSLSIAASFQFYQVKLSEKLSFKAGIMLQTYLSKYYPIYALRKGAVFTLTFPIELNKPYAKT